MPTPTHTELPEYSRALLDAAPDAMVITDREGRIVLVNARVESLFGYRRDELLGRGVEVLMPERFHASHPEHRLRYFDEPHARAMGVGGLGLTARRKDGTEFAVEISLSPLETTDGVVAITAIRDISERRVAEEQAGRLIKAQESVRLRDEFLAVAAHELKTPLAALKLQVDGIGRLLARPVAPAPAVLTQRFAAVDRSVLRLSGLIDALLDLSRVSDGRLALERQPVDLVAIVHGVVAAFEHEAERARCAVTLAADEAELVGRWDPMRLEQVVTNLVSNALKYGDRKPVELRVGRGADGSARLEVRDHGIGVAPEDQARIFERFERAVDDRNFGGFGLGLWIVRQLVEAHGGAVTVESARGEGATFVVDLPLSGERRASLRPPGHPAPG